MFEKGLAYRKINGHWDPTDKTVLANASNRWQRIENWGRYCKEGN